ncbi:MAG: nucleoside-diphosphate kinase [Spirochaeta sp. LUC14_002_19_P3]|nr:MAG: nucleoside-diphosphate kinase [Spirochaeta sp. LUC14_002_19_P3]
MENNTTWEKTFILLKPDAVQRALIGAIIARFERAGLTLTALRLQNVSRAMAEKHYEAHRGKSFYEPLLKLLRSGPVVIMAVEGAHAISVVRKLVGATEPLNAAPGTIRGDFCHIGYERSRERLGVIPNLIHASDSPESAAAELALWFGKEEIAAPYQRVDAEFM